ncbi:uncharacterized protein FOMMEDRAFT_26175 [Fomitiporia mediterranea MF3/22]|uniref:uncharacterized protein n=1 Tax=Fomitiporia mediterranea (strain MF3/22) TaxID=694068 RepID=UPI0004409026|nr:uncharacterized protein FOMMEDRAFT_26175 [Fomitiporia mediterranea MF3/22]EJD07063.1 hypothetical protein FOMMEDRAFT_26175 [Fomitiporia mediterranea MF3/22]
MLYFATQITREYAIGEGWKAESREEEKHDALQTMDGDEQWAQCLVDPPSLSMIQPMAGKDVNESSQCLAWEEALHSAKASRVASLNPKDLLFTQILSKQKSKVPSKILSITNRKVNKQTDRMGQITYLSFTKPTSTTSTDGLLYAWGNSADVSFPSTSAPSITRGRYVAQASQLEFGCFLGLSSVHITSSTAPYFTERSATDLTASSSIFTPEVPTKYRVSYKTKKTPN